MQCRRQLCKSGSVAGSCTVASQGINGGHCSLSLEREFFARPRPCRGVKVGSDRSLVREELWRELRVRRLACVVLGRRRQQRAGAERSWLCEEGICSCVELIS